MKAILQDSEEPEKETAPPPEELPVREPDEFQDVPVPRRVTRETDAEQKESTEREDLQQGDEGVDDPPPESDQMGD